LLTPWRKIRAPCTQVGLLNPPVGDAVGAWGADENGAGVVSCVEAPVDKGSTVYAAATALDVAAICVE
jgi:hypothetical protein